MNRFILAALLTTLLAVLCRTVHLSLRRSGKAGTERLKERYPKSAGRIERWQRSWPQLTHTFVVLSVLCQFCTGVLIGLAIANWLPGKWMLAVAVAAGFYVLSLTGLHALTRGISLRMADLISVKSLPAAGLVHRLLLPLTIPLYWLDQSLIDALNEQQNGNDSDHSPSAEDEILSVVNQSDDEDLEDEERRMIRRALKLDDTLVREIMTPRVHIRALDGTLTGYEALYELKDAIYSRFPVYGADIDNIQGILHVKDLLKASAENQLDQSVLTLTSDPKFIREELPVDDLLADLRETRQHFAVVLDEFGGTAGVVTLEDILEELVGEIEDEYDVEQTLVNTVSEGIYLVEAKTPVTEINQRFQIGIPVGLDYDSIGGYVSHELGRIARRNETLEGDGFKIRITEASAHQLHKLEIKISKPVQEQNVESPSP